jgi:hypothetical protein
VAWDFLSKRYVVADRDDLKNINAGKALDREPGISIVRDRLHTQEAWRIAKALNLPLLTAKELA